MLTLTAATRSLFAKPQRESAVAELQLEIYLIDTFLCDNIGPLVSDAVDRGLLKDLDLAILDEKGTSGRSPSDEIKRAQDIDGFFCAYPSVLHCLTSLSLYGIWLQPEIKQLTSAFRKLRKLLILGVFVEFDLLWTTTFLEAAPSIEMLHIEVCEHACELGDENDESGIFAERINPLWELDFHASKNMLLRELHIAHFRPLEQQLTFIRAILERAPNLQTVMLNKDGEICNECDAMALDVPPSASARPAFPRTNEEQDSVVRWVIDGTFFSGQIYFR
ncbi:hypothetical protein VPH35_094238 [Triticum aestivum]